LSTHLVRLQLDSTSISKLISNWKMFYRLRVKRLETIDGDLSASNIELQDNSLFGWSSCDSLILDSNPKIITHPVNGPTVARLPNSDPKRDLLERCLKFRRDREESNGQLDTKSIIYGSNPSLPSVGMRNACGLPIESSLVLRGLRTITPIENLLIAIYICHVRSIKLYTLHALDSRVRRNKAALCSSTLSTSIFV